jgi:hypothetical protein
MQNRKTPTNSATDAHVAPAAALSPEKQVMRRARQPLLHVQRDLKAPDIRMVTARYAEKCREHADDLALVVTAPNAATAKAANAYAANAYENIIHIRLKYIAEHCELVPAEDIDFVEATRRLMAEPILLPFLPLPVIAGRLRAVFRDVFDKATPVNSAIPIF